MGALTANAVEPLMSDTHLLISDDFDSGNIVVLDTRDPLHIALAIRPDTRSGHFQWFHFKVEGLNIGKLHGFDLGNAGQSSYHWAWEGYQAVASYDHENWFRVPSQYDGQTLRFELEAEQPQVWFAYFEPYSRQRHGALIERVTQHPGTELVATGRSVEGRDIELLRVGSGAPGRLNVWVTAQQHPGEHMAEWFMEGLLGRLQDGADEQMQTLLAGADFYLIPNMNPDGAFHGHLRTNAQGNDLNRAWQNANAEDTPEVLFAQQHMARVGVDLFLDIHGDEAIPYVFTAGCEGNPGFTPRIDSLQQYFRKRLGEVTRDFQSVHGYPKAKPGQANMNLACNSTGQRFDCLAFTLEMPFKDNDDAPNPRTGWSGARSANLARDLLSVVTEMLPMLR